MPSKGAAPTGSGPDLLATVASALVVCAHPDDESFGLGAVLDHLAKMGIELSVLCLTHGEASTLGARPGGLARLRADELSAAAGVLGVASIWLHDHPDGMLAGEDSATLAAELAAAIEKSGAELLLVFDRGGVTGHPDHERATALALSAPPELPVLAWTLPAAVASQLNDEFGTTFLGRSDDEIDIRLAVDRSCQRRAIACHLSQSGDNPVLWRRLELLGAEESLRWLRRPA